MNWSPRASPTPPSSSIATVHCSDRGTSSSPPLDGRLGRERGCRNTVLSEPRPKTYPPASPQWVSTSSTFRRSIPSARSTARDATTLSLPNPVTSARRGPSARSTAGTTLFTRNSARSRTSRPSSRRPASSISKWHWISRCSAPPDHPWAKKHPEWFNVLPDGTIAYAENPPKKYQDIYPINFDTDPRGLDKEILRVVRHWISAGVKIFRVDNPHTKPPNFWETLISEVKKTDPDVLFLAEAFTRPARMYGLARRGFTQSYTYFTWRVAKWELTEFGNELAAKADEARPNLFVNTPDILHESLQHGGPGMFALRAALAATLAPTWGVYSGYELYEHQAVRPGSEEYLDSEKYELRPRRFAEAAARGESLEPWITALNRIRRAHPALQQLRNLHFHHIDNDALIAYSKFDASTGDAVLTVINLNPFAAEEGTVWLDMPALGREWHDHMTVLDEVTGEQFNWGQANFVRLEPWRSVAHILALPPVPYPARISLAYQARNAHRAGGGK